MFDDFYMGIVMPFAGTKEPEGWMFCQGQELQIAEYEALFTLLGNTFGGNGATTFALPDLRGRAAVHSGRGYQMQDYHLGQTGGNETVLIAAANLPAHSHELVGSITGKPPCANSKGSKGAPAGNYPAIINGGAAQYTTSVSGEINMGAITITSVSPPTPDEVKEPIEVLSPFCTMNYIICVQGIFPPRD
jgi:microcystin-dependent protein